MPLVRISTPEGARKLLQRLIEGNRCTLEDLDTPPPGHINPQAYRNLMRDEPPQPRVELVSPRDLPAPEEPLPF